MGIIVPSMTAGEELQLDETKAKPRRRRRRRVIILLSIVATLGILCFGAWLLLPGFLLKPVRFEGQSMDPTIKNGDRVFLTLRVEPLERGDIVAYNWPPDPTKSFMSRIIGLPGDKLDIDSVGRLMINGSLLEEPYIDPNRNLDSSFKFRRMNEQWKQVPEDSFFVMGDNRDAANDSRYWGPVPRRLIWGKYVLRYWSSE
jgi:signal peptidase I